MTEKERAALRKFFERHPHPPYAPGEPNAARYYPNEGDEE